MSSSRKKKQTTVAEDSEDTMMLNELMADAGILESELNDDNDDEEPECTTQ